jgi:RND family efflux transporter MFP subunit
MTFVRSLASSGHSLVSRGRTPVGLAYGLPLALVALAACGGERTDAAAPARFGAFAMPVQLAVVRPVPIEDASEYLATIQSLSSTSIKPEVSGEVTRIYVKSGDHVTAGTPLVQIDPRRQEATVSSQAASLAAQESSVTYARQQLDRAKTLLAAGAISQQGFDQAKTNYDSAQSQLSALNALLHEGRVTLQYYDVKAPAVGTVGDIPIRVGMHVTSDTLLTSVDRNESLEVYVQVPLERSGDLKTGLPLQILDGASGVRLADTTVSFISPSVDDQTQSVLVKGRLTGTGALRSSQFVRARIVWRTTEGLVVPVLSVVRINGQPFVFVAEQQSERILARQRPVKLGPMTGNNFTVVSGLEANERIVVSGVQKIANGAPIAPA